MGSGIEARLLDLLAVFILAAGVGIAVVKVVRVPYTIALLFEGAATTDLDQFRSNPTPILALAVPGLSLSVLVLGIAGQ